MKYHLVVFLFIVGCANTSHANLIQQSFLLTDVNIVDVKHKQIIRGQNLFIQNGIIKKISSDLLSFKDKNLPIIAGKGGYVTPGLIDMHVHMFEPAAYTIALSHGVTHVRVMNGVPAQLKWRDQVENGTLIGSSSTVSSPILSGFMDAYLHHGVQSTRAAQAAVQKYHAQGYDLIKAYGNLNPQALKAVLDAAKALNIPVAKHGPHASGEMLTTSLVGVQSLEHVEDIYQGPLNYQFDTERLTQAITELRAIGVPITPTLNIFYQLTKLSVQKDAFLASQPQQYTSDIIALEAKTNQVSRWLNASDKLAAHNQQIFQFLLDITKRLHESDVALLVGSDSGVLLSPHGLATHTEMALLQKAGLNSFDVLAAATITPAKTLAMDNKIGQVKANFSADFVFTKVNPVANLEALRTPDAVVKKGIWYSQKELQALRNKAIDERSIWQEIITLFEAL
ncbi:amidohydrolase family protein [Alteromonas sp. ASW11-130]|uniref:amidohydrolase family protein n=1 Tax=Alteromonas sp. ASW11-130 TaxID=3015775 RepID=UPI002241D66B|nr:amidohydrolase family protein [Alteromonas sp. ASW11-130]MCW8093339.1 amidohydrolase family protein [Alteromonas sp. ASW11-130]